jgi:hypothetical protein
MASFFSPIYSLILLTHLLSLNALQDLCLAPVQAVCHCLLTPAQGWHGLFLRVMNVLLMMNVLLLVYALPRGLLKMNVLLMVMKTVLLMMIVLLTALPQRVLKKALVVLPYPWPLCCHLNVLSGYC